MQPQSEVRGLVFFLQGPLYSMCSLACLVRLRGQVNLSFQPHAHSVGDLQLEGIKLSLLLSSYTRDDNLHRSLGVIGEPFILAINNLSVGLRANSRRDRGALVFRWKARLVSCLGAGSYCNLQRNGQCMERLSRRVYVLTCKASCVKCITVS